MKTHLKQTIIGTMLALFLFPSATIARNGDYPKTVQERKMDEMGSIVGGEGLVFRPSRIKNESTKTVGCNVNKYLWQASIETLRFVPLASTDSVGGVIITEWYSPKGQTNFRFKINIFIKDNVISLDAIQVKIFEQTLKNGNWLDNHTTSDLANSIEDKILRKSRELYISAERKE
ncbi:DUF3576 domain-containing protein [Candidatus Tisiphia endosymbiont of Neophilaenus lineatus]|uniref:DUF3576 domain-containing protein n=1 Tax=Candidatus Tisiphia endosymbiont of Neophilaenus lineatus TaxID=3139336 RepID=UPI0035CBD384